MPSSGLPALSGQRKEAGRMLEAVFWIGVGMAAALAAVKVVGIGSSF